MVHLSAASCTGPNLHLRPWTTVRSLRVTLSAARLSSNAARLQRTSCVLFSQGYACCAFIYFFVVHDLNTDRVFLFLNPFPPAASRFPQRCVFDLVSEDCVKAAAAVAATVAVAASFSLPAKCCDSHLEVNSVKSLQTTPGVRSAWASKLFDSPPPFVSLLPHALFLSHPSAASPHPAPLILSSPFVPLFFSHFLPLSIYLLSSHLPALPLPLPSSFSRSSPNPSSPP